MGAGGRVVQGVIAATALGLAVACTAGSAPPPPQAATAPAPETTTAEPERRAAADLGERLRDDGLPVFDGVGDFYVPPEPLPFGEPGALIRVQPVARKGLEGIDVVLVMYHSRNRDGDDVAVTGLVAIPRGEAPPGGRRVMSWAHGTSGLAPQCAPSRNTDAFNRKYVDAGYIVAATDYLGLGPPPDRTAAPGEPRIGGTGRHPYLSGITEGRSVIDLVRAVQRVPSASAGNEWVVFGHSQGGHAAIFTAEIAAFYAPETQLIGAVAMAPVGDLTNLMPYAASPIRGIGVMIVYGLAEENPDLNPSEYLTDLALAKASVLDTGCNGDIAEAYAVAFSANDLLRKDPGVFEPARTILKANDPGQVKTAVPVLIVHGGSDWIVPPGRSEFIYDLQCSLGVTVERTVYDDADHTTILEAAGPRIDSWIDARFSGFPATSDCPPS